MPEPPNAPESDSQAARAEQDAAERPRLQKADDAARRVQLVDAGAKVFDVLFKAIIAVVATWWAIRSFGLQQTQTDKNIRVQLETQREAARSQREMQEATLIASVIGHLKCQGSPEDQLQQVMALNLVKATAPRFSGTLSEILMGCAKTPNDRKVVEEFRDQSEKRQQAARFLDVLANARQSRRFGLKDVLALEEFEKARSLMPKAYETYWDAQEFGAAQRARREGRFAEASDHYERAFSRIDNSQSVSSLPARVSDGK